MPSTINATISSSPSGRGVHASRAARVRATNRRLTGSYSSHVSSSRLAWLERPRVLSYRHADSHLFDGALLERILAAQRFVRRQTHLPTAGATSPRPPHRHPDPPSSPPMVLDLTIGRAPVRLVLGLAERVNRSRADTPASGTLLRGARSTGGAW
jgi:hypothetical protein